MRCSRSHRVREPRRRERGQALIETAIVVMVVMTLFVGVYACAVGLSDAQQGGSASRSAARFAAQTGSSGYKSTNAPTGCQTTAADPCAVDDQILRTALASLGGLSYTRNLKITVYQPCSDSSSPAVCASSSDQCAQDSSYYGAGAPFDSVHDRGEVFTQSGGVWTSTAPYQAYDLSMRVQRHPQEAVVGVQVEADYSSPTPFVKVNVHLREYAVNCLAPAAS
jgi:Flp pilus assembly protein TadG